MGIVGEMERIEWVEGGVYRSERGKRNHGGKGRRKRGERKMKMKSG